MAKENLSIDPAYPDNEPANQLRADNVFGMFKTVSIVPTATPKNWYDQIVIYKNGATLRLYAYNVMAASWNYTTLT